MIEPTGYTALDLIGYTDRGAFAANANYVKNDLVHYGGNIWRVLIDDTIGVTPSEGVNYTLFIGEPTNLVERIIAPLEENPATIAYTIGRQIIYNDYLYEVIDDIAVGDTLVAYEDDPTNANIKLAPAVETQVLAIKSDLADAVDDISNKADKTQISNPNLLDNPWFTVNQRGQSSYTVNGYTVDRWRTWDDTKPTTISNNGVSLFGLWQYFESSLTSFLLGQTVTVSVKMQNGNIHHQTVTLPTTAPSQDDQFLYFSDISDNVTFTLDYEISRGNVLISVHSLDNINPALVRAVKLELGSVSTLAMDTAPNYAEELLKCERYYIRLALNDPVGTTTGPTAAYMSYLTPTAMRATPSIVGSVSGNLICNGSYFTIENAEVTGIRNNVIYIKITSTGLPSNHVCAIQNSSIALTADL